MSRLASSRSILFSVPLMAVLASALAGVGQTLPDAAVGSAQPRGAILDATEVIRFLPVTLFLRGKQLFVESRNAGGIRFTDSMYLVTARASTLQVMPSE